MKMRRLLQLFKDRHSKISVLGLMFWSDPNSFRNFELYFTFTDFWFYLQFNLKFSTHFVTIENAVITFALQSVQRPVCGITAFPLLAVHCVQCAAQSWSDNPCCIWCRQMVLSCAIVYFILTVEWFERRFLCLPVVKSQRSDSTPVTL